MTTREKIRHTYTIDVAQGIHLRRFYVEIDPTPGGWWATVYDPDLTYVYGPPRVPLSPDGCVAGAPGGGPLCGPYIEALGRAITTHFHGDDNG